jgi:hypothetical protein
MPYPFQTAQLYAPSLSALIATPIEFQVVVGPRAAGADTIPIRIEGDGFPLDTQEALSRLVLDWEAVIHCALPAAAALPPGTYALTRADDGTLHAAGEGVAYPVPDRAVVVEVVSVPEEKD